jgi:hypothetical protein
MNNINLKLLPESKSDPCISENGKECCFLKAEESCIKLRTVCIKEKIVYVKE